MIKVIYKANLGNNMFQYALGRILAEEKGYALAARPIVFPLTHQKISGLSCQQPVEKLPMHHCDVKRIIGDKTPRMIHLEGFFQHSEYYLPYLDRIREWFQFPLKALPQFDVSTADMLLYIRLGDYFSKEKFSMTHQFYEDAIEMASPRKVYIATDEPAHSYLEKFKKYDPIYLSGTPVIDLLTAQLFQKIAMSSSTFAWWAVMLSDAREIYFPVAEDHWWSHCYKRSNFGIDLRVDDPKFIYFYNCPTVRTWRVSPSFLPLEEFRPDVAGFHMNSRAFWYV